jgi:hypothetical protein
VRANICTSGQFQDGNKLAEPFVVRAVDETRPERDNQGRLQVFAGGEGAAEVAGSIRVSADNFGINLQHG